MASTIAVIVISALIGLDIFITIRRYRKESYIVKSLLRLFRPIMVLECLLVIGSVIATYSLLALLPFMRYGWASVLLHDGGNIVFTPLNAIAHSGIGVGWTRLFLSAIFLLMMPCVPFWALREEESYRIGRITWKKIVPTSIRFGLMHLIVGIPLAGGWHSFLAVCSLAISTERPTSDIRRRAEPASWILKKSVNYWEYCIAPPITRCTT